ncbi:MAG: hypothetical protein JRE40_01170 [Deltaproteobacteria bacterium]|nr:hypothetical protein [Deltaproteobacteria bacterium]
MVGKNPKKSYYLPKVLTDYLAKWSSPGRDYSASVSGALLVWMGLPAEIRKEATRLSEQSGVPLNIEKIRVLLRKSIVDSQIQAYLDTLTDEEKAQILIHKKAAAERIGRKK